MVKIGLYKFFIFSIIFFQSACCIAQTSICRYLQLASESFYEKNYSLALDNLLSVRNNPPIEPCDIINLRIGQCYSYLNDTTNAMLEFTRIINDSSTHSSFIKYYGAGCNVKWDSTRALPIWIFDENGCDNNKNKACLELFDLSIRKNDLNSAGYFLDLANRKYFYRSTCGNDYDWHDIELKQKYHELYKVKKDTTLILNNLISGMFLCDSALHSELVHFLRAKYTIDEISFEVNNVSTTYLENSKNWNNGKVYVKRTIVFFGVEVEINRNMNDFFRCETSDDYKQKLSTLNWFLNLAK